MKELIKGSFIELSESAVKEYESFFNTLTFDNKLNISIANIRYGCKVCGFNEHKSEDGESFIKSPIFKVDKVYRETIKLSPKDIIVNSIQDLI